MKKLFLASVAAVTLDKIVPTLLPSSKNVPLAFIPTAADPYDDKPWLYEDRNKAVQMGFNIKDIDLKGKNKFKLQQELSACSVVFVAGGNTFYLLEKVIQSGFDSVIKDEIASGKIYIGSSAGSILLAPTIEYAELLDDPKVAKHLNTYQGLNLVDYLIFPHVTKEKYQLKFEQVNKKWTKKGYKVIPLRDNQAVIHRDNEFEVITV
jgi:dipeptidase E